MDKLCPCRTKDVAPATVFEMVTVGKTFPNADTKCEFAGYKICQMIESGEIDQIAAINDCMTFARQAKAQGKKDSHMLSWMCKHLALGLCHKFNLKDRVYVRNIMKEILPLSRGIDAGMFFRDILALGEDGQFLSPAETELLQKAMYFLKISSGFRIDMRNTEFAKSVYGPVKANIPKMAYYIDLPIGNPAYGCGTAPSSTSNALLAACESLKPHAVLLLLRYGASAHGEPLAYTMASLAQAKTIADKAKRKVANSPLESTKLMLNYLLRSVSQLKLRFDDQRDGENDHDSDVYYVHKNIESFVDDCYYKSPNKLGQLCRVKIRKLLMDNDQLPAGIETFQKPFVTTHKRFVDLLN